MRKNMERGNCKEQQLSMEFTDIKDGFTSRDIRKKPKEHAHGEGATHVFHQSLYATCTINIYLPHRTTCTEIHAYTWNAMLRQIKKELI
jgi:hypothetical protein